MRLKECEIEGLDAAVGAPIQRFSAEPDWVAASSRDVVPSALMRLYTRANFLSFGTAPKFLADPSHIIFSYFSIILRGLKESLTDAEDELAALAQAEERVYGPGKASRGERWDENAPVRSKKHFRLLLVSLWSSLDCVADLIALLLPNAIPHLKLGKADFQDVETWLKRDMPSLGGIVTPQQIKAQQLYKGLKPLVEADEEERDWLPLAKMMRNKSAHLGTEHFREIGFHDKNGVFYSFLPRKWPFLWEQYIRQFQHADPSTQKPDFGDILASLMEQDKLTYLYGLRAKVTSLVAASVEVLDSVYAECKDFEADPGLAKCILDSTKEYQFVAFKDR